MSLADRLAGYGIRLRSSVEGDHRTTCPVCSAQRKKKTDPCLSVTISPDGAVWDCWHCGYADGFRDRDATREPRRLEPKRDLSALRFGPLTTRAIDFFAARGIAEEALRDFGVGCSHRWFAEPRTELDCIAFPYRKPGGAVVNAKYRSFEKHFSQEKGGEKIFWAIDRMDPSLGEAVIVEGECDVLALATAGVVNAISVPDGAPKTVHEGEIDPADDKKFAYVWNCREDLDQLRKIVIATDADAPGRALAEELCRRLGRERCWLVEWPDGCKDANDVLVKLGQAALERCVAQARPHPIKNLFGVDDYRDAVLALHRGGRRRGVSTGWSRLDPLLTIRPGELSVVTGITHTGKSEFIDAMLLNLAEIHGWRFAMCSFENPPDEHLVKLSEKRGRAGFKRMTEEQLGETLDWLRDHFDFIRAEDESPTVDFILDRARAAVMRYGTKGLVIDPYNEIDHKRPRDMTETEYVSELLAKVKRFAHNHGCHVWFVAHPQKMQREKTGKPPVPTLYDISGSAHWANKADNGIVVSRDWSEGGRDVEIHVKKVRFKAVGRVGVARLTYDYATGRYLEIDEAAEAMYGRREEEDPAA